MREPAKFFSMGSLFIVGMAGAGIGDLIGYPLAGVVAVIMLAGTLVGAIRAKPATRDEHFRGVAISLGLVAGVLLHYIFY